MRSLIVNEKYNKMNISKVLFKEFPNLKKNSLYKLLRLKDIKVNDIRIKEDIVVNANDKIIIYADDFVLLGLSKIIEYYYEDDNIIVAFKPKGIISNVKDDNIDSDIPSFEQLVKNSKNDINNNIHICHRLDTNTEGLVIFSKNETSNKELLNAFKNSYITKTYLAFAHGYFDKKHDILSGYISKDPSTSYSKIVNRNIPNSKSVITEYNVLKYFPDKNISAIEVTLHTGRTHQIRAHMKSINHPIIGDSKYGINQINKQLNINSQLLLAYKYIFNFPEDSPLYYLNTIVISIDKDKFLNMF